MHELTLDAYQRAAARTLPEPTGTQDDTIRALILALGLCGEAGEAADRVKKIYGHGHDASKEAEALQRELGDTLWYLSALCTVFGMSLGEVADANIKKLMARYPSGFSSQASRERAE